MSRLNSFLCTLLIMFVTFVIGWYCATDYVMKTLQVEVMPEIERIAVTNYLGNSDFHYMKPVEQLVLEDDLSE